MLENTCLETPNIKEIPAKQNFETLAWEDYRLPQLNALSKEKNAFIATEFWSPLATTYNRYHPYWAPEQAKNTEEANCLFSKFKENNWFMFAFLRHPGDVLCSMYNYGKEKGANTSSRWYFNYSDKSDCYFYWFNPNESLDEFISRDPLPLPRLWFDWRALDFITHFSVDNLQYLITKYFGINNKISNLPENKSGNLGYDHYCQQGLISKKNQERIMESDFFKIYSQVPPRPFIKL